MLTPSLLLQAFQLPPSLKGSESEQKRQPDADSTTTRKRLSQTKQVYNQEGKGRSSSAWPLTPNVPMRVGVKPQRRSRKPPLLLKWQVQVGILSALLFTVSLSSSSSVHTSHNLILMGELCLQFSWSKRCVWKSRLTKFSLSSHFFHWQVPGQDRINSETTCHDDFPAL